jgi:acyl-CoA synthetase (AMP-forming)/AMP-acid ligase II
LIIRGGENIHPLEVENCILSHPGVTEVSVVGVPDDRYGEAVAAFVTIHKGSKLTAEEVRDWMKSRLSHHLIPKYVFWIGIDEYPKTASGKIQKFRLTEMGKDLIKAGRGTE